jgi:hypothetical protein
MNRNLNCWTMFSRSLTSNFKEICKMIYGTHGKVLTRAYANDDINITAYLKYRTSSTSNFDQVCKMVQSIGWETPITALCKLRFIMDQYGWISGQSLNFRILKEPILEFSAWYWSVTVWDTWNTKCSFFFFLHRKDGIKNKKIMALTTKRPNFTE